MNTLDWNELSQQNKEIYLMRAKYLVERGYYPNADIDVIAESIYETEQRLNEPTPESYKGQYKQEFLTE